MATHEPTGEDAVTALIYGRVIRLLPFGMAALLAVAGSLPPAAAGEPAPPTTRELRAETTKLLGDPAFSTASRSQSRDGGIGPGSGSDGHGGLLPNRKLLTLYGAPQLGASVLGRLGPGAATRKLVKQTRAYARLSDRPVIPGFDLIAVITNSTPGPDGLYRTRQPNRIIRTYLRAARSVGGRLMLDIQPGRARIVDEIEALERWVSMPIVDVSIDPEWNVGKRELPGETNGGMSARELNAASRLVQKIIDENDLPPKVLAVHQFHSRSVRNREDVRQRRDVDVTLSFDGGGSPSAKEYGYEVLSAGAALTGFSIFYSLDAPLMSPRAVLRLRPEPDFLLFQ